MKPNAKRMMPGTPLYCFLVLCLFDCRPAMSEDKVAELGKVEVTGSHIKRVDMEGPSPVLVISREDIERRGVTTVSELLRSLPQQTGDGTYDEKFTSGFAPGSAGISLRGLGQDSTLVLINGQRVSNYGFAQDLTQTFVDLNSIPLAAVERVEILKDGASAIYGSDAIAGVVNIILRRDYDGSQIAATYGVSQKGDGNETRLNYVGGRSGTKGNVTLAVDYFKRDEILRADRKFSRTADHSNKVGGIDLTSAATPVSNVFDTSFTPLKFDSTYNFNTLATLVPKTERIGGLLDFNRELTASINFKGQVLLSRDITDAQAAATPSFADFLIPAGQTYNTYGQDVFTLWRMVEMGPRKTRVENTLQRATAGLEGLAGAWDWSVSANYNRTRTVLNGKNYVNVTELTDAVDNNQINPFGTSPNSQAVLDQIRTKIGRVGEFDLYGGQAKASRAVMDLDAGPIQMAVGGEWRHEELSDQPDALSGQGLVVSVGTTSAKGDRNVSALYTEFDVPLREDLELQLAGRFEDYSDFGTTSDPKVALRYQPIHQVVFRASWGTGFRAPSLAELYLGDTSSFDFIVDTTRCNAVGLDCAPNQDLIVTSSNKNLDPQQSTSYYLGTVVEPVPDLTVGVEYWNYSVKDVITQNAQYVVDNEGQFPGSVVRGPGTVPGDPGPISQVNNMFVNLAKQKTDGIDLDIRYHWSLGEGGIFSIRELASRMLNFTRQAAPGAPTENFVGNYRYPRWRSTTTFNWLRGDYNTSLIANFIDSYEDKFNPDLKVKESMTFDFQLVYSGIRKSDVTLGVKNIFDDRPPFANEEEGYDFATYNPMGRYFYATYKYAFK